MGILLTPWGCLWGFFKIKLGPSGLAFFQGSLLPLTVFLNIDRPFGLRFLCYARSSLLRASLLCARIDRLLNIAQLYPGLASLWQIFIRSSVLRASLWQFCKFAKMANATGQNILRIPPRSHSGPGTKMHLILFFLGVSSISADQQTIRWHDTAFSLKNGVT